MKNFALLSAILFVTFVLSSAQAAYQWGFADASVNYLDWDKQTEDKSTKKDFTFLELEGGAQYDWGEIYGFFDVENPGKETDEVRTASKASLRYYLGISDVSIYTHVYNFAAFGFSEQNRVLGLGYQLTGEGWWFKPFIGFHEVTGTFFSGLNGYMAGWVLGYSFKAFGQDFLLADWHEYEFDRKDAYAAGNGDKKTSNNGAASIWWNVTKEFNVGVQWRYAVDKLGTAGPQNASITTLKYNF